jgi:hypothetical protein
MDFLLYLIWFIFGVYVGCVTAALFYIGYKINSASKLTKTGCNNDCNQGRDCKCLNKSNSSIF